jgi:hypothetical protein
LYSKTAFFALMQEKTAKKTEKKRGIHAEIPKK